MILPPITRAMGWIKDLPDFRDKLFTEVFYDISHLPWRGWLWWKKPIYPASVDLVNAAPRGTFPPIFDQGQLSSCVPNAVARMLEFVESIERPGQVPILSRLFMYYYARLGPLGAKYDMGCSVRLVLAGIQLMGVPTEDLWPYDVTAFATEPSLPAKENAKLRKKIEFARLTTQEDMLNCLSQGYPFVIGLTLFKSFETVTDQNGQAWIPMPSKTDTYLGGHEVCCVGVDMNIICPDGTKGAFRIANSWNTSWGDQGYAWLPFNYADSLSDDIWTARYIALA